jgi:hypothetical protein
MSPLDGWLKNLEPQHHDLKRLELRIAKALSKEWRLGWYVSPWYGDWQIGKMTVTNPFQRYTIVRDDGSPLLFPSVDNALSFFRQEMGVYGVAMFQS